MDDSPSRSNAQDEGRRAEHAGTDAARSASDGAGALAKGRTSQPARAAVQRSAKQVTEARDAPDASLVAKKRVMRTGRVSGRKRSRPNGLALGQEQGEAQDQRPDQQGLAVAHGTGWLVDALQGLKLRKLVKRDGMFVYRANSLVMQRHATRPLRPCGYLGAVEFDVAPFSPWSNVDTSPAPSVADTQEALLLLQEHEESVQAKGHACMSSTEAEDGTDVSLLFFHMEHGDSSLDRISSHVCGSSTALSTKQERALRCLIQDEWLLTDAYVQPESCQIVLHLYLSERAITNVAAPVLSHSQPTLEMSHSKSAVRCSRSVLELLNMFGLLKREKVDTFASVGSAGADLNDVGVITAGQFYGIIRRTMEQEQVQSLEMRDQVRARICENLSATLRPYQEKSVLWMLARERDQRWNRYECLHPFWQPLELPKSAPPRAATCSLRVSDCSSSNAPAPASSVCLYVNAWTGSLSEAPIMYTETITGGVLCDEMGLGKTVEFLSLVAADLETKVKPEHGEFSVRLDQVSHDSCVAKESSTAEEDICRACGSKEEPANSGGQYTSIQNDQVELSSWISCDECFCWYHGACLGYRHEDVPRLSRSAWLCPACTIKDVRIDTDATLLIVPRTLLSQWVSELQKHMIGSIRTYHHKRRRDGEIVSSLYAAANAASARVIDVGDAKTDQKCDDKVLNVRIYEGLRVHGYISPLTVTNADIVITTYEALGDDIHGSNAAASSATKNLRYFKKYQHVCPPLERVTWKRICLDEAQFAESVSSNVSIMVRRLSAQHMWCMTGTPARFLTKEVFGILQCIRAPVSELFPEMLKAADTGDVSAMVWMRELLRRLFWRFNKRDVREQLNLPDRTVYISRLVFGPIEMAFYKYQFETCFETARELIRRLTERTLVGNNISREAMGRLILDSHEASAFFSRLHSLRQACCHPQLGGGTGSAGIGRSMRSLFTLDLRRTDALTMEQVLAGLIKKTILDCEEALRLMLAHSNGLAALTLLESEQSARLVAAVSIYQRSLGQIEENRKWLDVDKLQLLHILANYRDVLMKRDAVLRDQASSVQQSPTMSALVSMGRTLREAQLVDEIAALEVAYVKPTLLQLQSQKSQLESSTMAVRVPQSATSSRSRKGLKGRGLEQDEEDELVLFCWSGALEIISRRDAEMAEALVEKVKIDLLSRFEMNGSYSSIATKFRNIHGLRAVLHDEQKHLAQARLAMTTRLQALPGYDEHPSDAQSARSGNCRKCRPDALGEVCEHCLSEAAFRDYERYLFSVRRKHVKRSAATAAATTEMSQPPVVEALAGNLESDSELQDRGGATISVGKGGVRLQGELEHAVQIIASFCRRSAFKDDSEMKLCVERFPAYFKYMEALKKEFKFAHAVFQASKDLLSVSDELSMAKMRVGLRNPNEQVSVAEKRFRILAHEVIPMRKVLDVEYTCSAEELDRKKGQLFYLSSLQNAGGSRQGMGEHPHGVGENCEPAVVSEMQCAVCWNPISWEELSVFPCGHTFCVDCPAVMFGRLQVQSRYIKCPSCRAHVAAEEVCFTRAGAVRDAVERRQGFEVQGEEFVQVRGSFGTKIEAIVRRIIVLVQSEPGVKILVFSQWNAMLTIIAQALRHNEVSFIDAQRAGAKDFSSMVLKFRQDETYRVLLLSLRRGANGLNLTEASHIVLVEPILNPSMEAQAIGRIDRMGQTQHTYVHHFVVDGTVEEKIFSIRSKKEELSHVDVGTDVNSSMKEDISLADVHDMFEL
ncbi:E3 ubiquitin-protein ligase SHPRH [Porphyridium purpureum]|uniref:E3 ubiquitin-protein ligase SHPRH n=1 Tax=Porphyridium purpureum TaxID=35688 RepID=A0A5J4YX30_PORPP|nr:E3 ubiquitin-protein ligase SHPRH [Porphyridium purpureum]|eukprot:POR9354..scf209_3